jgi:1-acyl-sn-glycerol-3-phosphate acyltransferase
MIAIDRKATRPVPRRDNLFVQLLRIALIDFLRLLYRIRLAGRENIPEAGGAVVIHNHVSVIDWLLIAVTCPRVPRFVMHVGDYDRPVLKHVFDAFGAIPIATQKQDPDLLARAYESIDDALAAGDLVAICPEGKMTPDGEMKAFKDGVTRIVRRRPVPVVPVALTGLWGSFFSRKGGAPCAKLPRAWRANVRVVVGVPIPPREVTTDELFERVDDLRGGRR